MAVAEHGPARIRYEDGVEGRPAGQGLGGPPVLFVHGGLRERMDGRRFWAAPGVAGAVAAAGYCVLLPDRRWAGGGTTAPVTEHTWALEGGDLAVLRHAGAAPALVVAGSNGCSAAARFNQSGRSNPSPRLVTEPIRAAAA